MEHLLWEHQITIKEKEIEVIMEQYIDKAAVVAEIERIMDAENESINSFERHRNTSEKQRYNARMALLAHILSFLNTPEVKEVDFEKEVTNWWNDHYKKINDDYEFGKYNGHYMENSTIINFAKHFFELGMQQSKNEELQ